MRSAAIFFSLATFMAANIAAAEPDPKKIPAVKKVLDDAVNGIKENQKAFDEANETQLAKTRDELKEIAKKMLDDGKTDEATAVLNQVKTLDKEILEAANAPAKGEVGKKMAPQKPLLERMAGKWRRGGDNFVFVISPDGRIQISNGDQGKLVLAGPETAEVVLKSGWKLRFFMAQADVACGLEWDSRGRQTPGFVLERIE
jgi:hypothetical protein